MNISIRKATIYDLKAVTNLTMILYESRDYAYLENENRVLLQKENQVVFLAFDNENAIAFAHCSLRSDYVESTSSCPVGFLEGIYVKKDYRDNGIARRLAYTCEQWAKEKGCSEFASDCELHNVNSLNFHLKIGFEEANRIICFTKKL